MKPAFFITVLSTILFLETSAKESALNTPEINQTIEYLLNTDDKVAEDKPKMPKRKSPTVGDFM